MDKNNDMLEAGMKREGLRLLRSTWVVEGRFMEGDMQGIKIRSISIRGPRPDKTGFLATVKCEDEAGGLWVAFVGGENLAEVENKMADFIEGEGLRLKPDQPYEDRFKGGF